MHQGKFESVTIPAGADLSAALYKAVVVGGTIAANNSAIGLLQSKPAAAGRHTSVGYLGQMKGYAGAAIAKGAAVSVTTSGYLVTVSSGDLGVGKTLAAANSGDLFPGLFNFVNQWG